MSVVNHWGKWVSSDVPVTGVVSLNSLEHIHDLVWSSDAINISQIDRLQEWIREKRRNLKPDPDVQPKDVARVRIADQFADRWIIYGVDFVITSSDDPTHPQGVWSFEEVSDWSKFNRELGVTVLWSDLPLGLRRHLIDFLDSGESIEPTAEMIAQWEEEFYNQDEEMGDNYIVGAWRKDDQGLYEPDDLTTENDFAAIVRTDSNVAQVVKSIWAIRAALCSPCYPGQADVDTPGEFMGYDFPDWVYGDRRQNRDACRFQRVDSQEKFWRVIAPTINRMIGLDDNAVTPVNPF